MSNDASLIAQYVVNATTLSAAQLQAATVSGGATPTTFDAGLIARWIVCISDPINQSGQWKFNPASVSHSGGVIGQNLIENYTAVLKGDVSGDWNPALPNRPAPEDPNGVKLSIPEATAQAGSIVTLPVSIGNLEGKGVTSYQFDVEYDPAVMRPVENAADLTGTRAETLTAYSNAPVPGLLKVVAFGALPVSGDGLYANLKFEVIGRAGASTPIAISGFHFNDGTVGTTTSAGSLRVTASDRTGAFNGRVLLADGRGLGRIGVVITSSSGETVSTTTSQLGYFSFEGLIPGETYTLRVESKRYRFAPVSIALVDNMGEVDITAEPAP
jgi:hypothetical protein